MKMGAHRLPLSLFAQISVVNLSRALFARSDRVGVERWGHCDFRSIDPVGPYSVTPFALVV
jgi:hypothetical protein